MKKAKFEWGASKDKQNQDKHGVSFEFAQYAFADPNRVIAEDLSHSQKEKRFYCFGKVGDGITNSSFHISWQRNTHNWCWLLAKREEVI